MVVSGSRATSITLLRFEDFMATILPQIKHIVVVMLENRSFDNMCGWTYSGQTPQPTLFLPAGSPAVFDGLNPGLWNPSNGEFFQGQAAVRVPVVQGTSSNTVPTPDPEETFDNVTFQLYGPEDPGPTPKFPMQGFVVNYENTHASGPGQIMETYSALQVPVITTLAPRVCDLGRVVLFRAERDLAQPRFRSCGDIERQRRQRRRSESVSLECHDDLQCPGLDRRELEGLQR